MAGSLKGIPKSVSLRTIMIRAGSRSLEWYDVNARIADFTQKAIDDRAVQQHVPTRTRRLAEDYMCDPFFARVINERIGDATAFKFHDFCAEGFSEANVFVQDNVIVWIDAAGLLLGGFNIDSDPIRRQPPGDAGARAQDSFGAFA